MKRSVKVYLYKAAKFFLALLFVLLFVRAWYYHPRVGIELISGTENFKSPTTLAILENHTPEQSRIFAIGEKRGALNWVNDKGETGTIFDLSDRIYSATVEVGLLGVAFDPDFKTNRYIYTFFNLDNPRRSRLARFKLDENFKADLKSELIILEVRKYKDVHNGGCLIFGPDGMFYVSIGDSNLAEVNPSMLKSRETLYGTIIRIDVKAASKQAPYRIPSDNPFVGNKRKIPEEVYAMGLRNPWRFSFDRENHKIYVGDVGAYEREEIDYIEAGKDYGWPFFEAEICRAADACKSTEFIPPLASFSHNVYLRSIVGGYVYRGESLHWLRGQYVFADYLRGLFSIDVSNQGTMVTHANILFFKIPTPVGKLKGRTVLISTLAEDQKGELYIANLYGGIYKLVQPSFLEKVRGFLFAMLSFR